MNKSWLRLLPLIIFIILAGFLWRGLSLDPHVIPSVKVGQKIPAFNLINLAGGPAVKPKNWRGRIVLLNIWASWCAACEQEQANLMQLAKEGVEIYGLNYKDKPENARKWLQTWGNPYRAVGTDETGKIAINLGVYGAPETFLIDQKGIVRYRHVGLLTPGAWQEEFVPIIHGLEQSQ